MRERTYFQCRTYRVYGKDRCHQHRINLIPLEKAVLDDIRSLAKTSIDNREAFVTGLMKRLGSETVETDKLKSTLLELEAKNEEADNRYIKLYDDLSAGIISESKFRLLSSRIEKEQEDNLIRISAIKKRLENTGADMNSVNFMADELSSCTEIESLTPEILNRLVEKIEIHEPEIIDGDREQKICIYYRFIGLIDQ